MESPQGAGPGLGARRLGGDGFDQGHSGAIRAFDQPPLGVGAPPFVGGFQCVDGFRQIVAAVSVGCIVSARRWGGANDAVDAAAVLAAFEVEEGPRFQRHVTRVVDFAAIHVGEVERAVRALAEKDRPEPDVGAGEKFFSCGGRLRAESRALGPEDLALHEILGGLADENVALVFRGQAGAAENKYAARRGERAGVRGGHQRGDEICGDASAADGENRRLGLHLRDLLDALAEREVRVACEVCRFEHDLHHRMPVGTEEAAAKRVERQAELTSAAGVFERVSVRVEAAVFQRERDGGAPRVGG